MTCACHSCGDAHRSCQGRVWKYKHTRRARSLRPASPLHGWHVGGGGLGTGASGGRCVRTEGIDARAAGFTKVAHSQSGYRSRHACMRRMECQRCMSASTCMAAPGGLKCPACLSRASRARCTCGHGPAHMYLIDLLRAQSRAAPDDVMVDPFLQRVRKVVAPPDELPLARAALFGGAHPVVCGHRVSNQQGPAPRIAIAQQGMAANHPTRIAIWLTICRCRRLACYLLPAGHSRLLSLSIFFTRPFTAVANTHDRNSTETK